MQKSPLIWTSVGQKVAGMVRAVAGVLLVEPVMTQAVSFAADSKERNAGEQSLALGSLAATCANCHGTYGRSAAGASITSLAGLSRAYFVQQMNDFKSGARPATLMHQLSKGYSDAQIDALAGYFAAQTQ